jgi:2'-5' RNA ligase
MRTVELLPDGELDRAVRAAWQRLDRAGFSSLGQHRHPTNRPHLTLASTDHFPPGSGAAIASALRSLPVPVRLEGLHFFGGRVGMLAWAFDGAGLRELQAQVWSALDGADRNSRHEPGAWAPHISLARRLQPGQVALAAQAVGAAVAGGSLSAGRSYDTATRTVVPLP